MNDTRAVPMLDLRAQLQRIRPEVDEAVERVIASTQFIQGEDCRRLEEEFAAYCGASHACAVANGTDALILALRAYGVGPGDEVVTVANTFIATGEAILLNGATPVFVDVDPATFTMDASQVEKAITPRTRVVLPVHLYGHPADMDAINALAGRHGLPVLEDAAQAHGAELRGRRTGSLGHAACFSFYPSKNLGALGDGGAICTSDPDIADRARALRHIGQRRKGEHELTGWNERLDGLQAAFLRAKLPYLDGWNGARRKRAERLRAEIAGGPLRLLEERVESPCMYHVFPVRSDDRDALAAALGDASIETGIHYSPACHRQPPFDDGGADRCPVASAWAAEELSLPMFEHLGDTEIDRVAAACKSAVAA